MVFQIREEKVVIESSVKLQERERLALIRSRLSTFSVQRYD